MITFIFGDSITLGLWDSQGGWADRFKRFVYSREVEHHLKDYHYVYNLGVDGNTTQQIIDRFVPEVKARLWHDETYAFIFATGINDTLHQNGQLASTPEKYQHQLHLLYHQASQYSHQIFFLDLNPVDESLTNPLKSSTTGKCYTNDRIDAFNSVLHQFCAQNHTNLIQINHLFKTQPDYRSLLIDGLHPNSHGHQLIFNEVLTCMQPCLDQASV
jgi:lysophospholipase L1-like esterase